MKKWFIKVWEEDMPMRERRMKVWSLGFVDFKGIDFVNKKNLKSKVPAIRNYNLSLPIPKITHEKNNTKEKVFLRKVSKSKNLGYDAESIFFHLRAQATAVKNTTRLDNNQSIRISICFRQ